MLRTELRSPSFRDKLFTQRPTSPDSVSFTFNKCAITQLYEVSGQHTDTHDSPNMPTSPITLVQSTQISVSTVESPPSMIVYPDCGLQTSTQAMLKVALFSVADKPPGVWSTLSSGWVHFTLLYASPQTLSWQTVQGPRARKRQKGEWVSNWPMPLPRGNNSDVCPEPKDDWHGANQSR